MVDPEDSAPTVSPARIVAVALLLAAPIVALLWVSSYAERGPSLLGFPFFYWYQFLWVFLAAACTSAAYQLIVAHERRRRAHRDAHGGAQHRGARAARARGEHPGASAPGVSDRSDRSDRSDEGGRR